MQFFSAMATVASSSSVEQEASNYDEVSMQQTLLLSDSLKDLKNLRTQLYSAAEYFELSYTNDDHKQIVVETLKDYAIKALVNTVDHLGSVTYKVNDFLDEKVDEVSGTDLRVSCIEQRLRTCQEFIDHEGLAQQLLVINTPKYHKRYVLPAGEKVNIADQSKLKYEESILDGGEHWRQFKNSVRGTVRETPAYSVRKGRPLSPSPSVPQQPGKFSFSKTMPKDLEKRTSSPHRFPLLRAGSLASRSTTPNPSRLATPKLSGERPRYPSEPRRSVSVRLSAEGNNSPKDFELQPSKGKRLLKSLLSRRKSRKDDMLYTYLDEY